jgi:transposase-like protein
VDFLLTAQRDLEAAKRFFRKMLQEEPLLSPDRIGTDGAGPPIHRPSRQPEKTAFWRAPRCIT